MVFDGLFVMRLKADGFSSQIIKICVLAPLTFFLSVNLLEKGYSRGSSAERSVCLCSHLLQAKSAIIFSSAVQAAEASLAYLTWNRMMWRMVLQNCSPGRLLEGSRSGEWGNQSLFTGVDGGGKVWRVSMCVSCLCLKPQSSLGNAPLIQSWE